jgi:hypothetical protein
MMLLLSSDDPLYQRQCRGELLLVVHRIRALIEQRPETTPNTVAPHEELVYRC